MSHLDHDVLRAVAPVGRIEVTGKPGRFAVEADVDVLTDCAVEPGADDLEHAAARAVSHARPTAHPKAKHTARI
jgi:hypothetical protein